MKRVFILGRDEAIVEFRQDVVKDASKKPVEDITPDDDKRGGVYFKRSTKIGTISFYLSDGEGKYIKVDHSYQAFYELMKDLEALQKEPVPPIHEEDYYND